MTTAEIRSALDSNKLPASPVDVIRDLCDRLAAIPEEVKDAR